MVFDGVGKNRHWMLAEDLSTNETQLDVAELSMSYVTLFRTAVADGDAE